MTEHTIHCHFDSDLESIVFIIPVTVKWNVHSICLYMYNYSSILLNIYFLCDYNNKRIFMEQVACAETLGAAQASFPYLL